MISTTNPDQDGETKFWYDRYGRIVASQNPVQADAGQYSYTLYDAQGRPVESGQISPVFPLSSTILSADDLGSSFQGWTSSGVKTEVTITRYDEPLSSPVNALFSNGQQNLRLRVASVLYFSTVTVFTDLTTAYLSAIHYSYDQHGNVVEQLQDVPLMAVADQAVKSTQYEFELISGNVKNVKYQPGKRDQMTHSYKYDQLNRLTEVFTSTDGNVHQSREAHYRYYDYGPLARTEIGQHKVQGMDYAYTINGWIKGMNSNTLKADRDMGLDGALGYLPGNGTVHENVARDVAGYTIGYFENDYKPIGLRTFEASVYGTSNDFKTVQKQLYNGNISHLVTAIQGFEVQGTAYQYDQLQRLKGMRVFRPAGLAASNSWAGSAETNEYKNSYSYDENGNILSLVRNGTASGLLMDNFAYKYIGLDNLPVASSDRKSNRLDFVNDTGADDAANDGDIKAGMLTGNYTYDKIGQLTADATEGISEIKWYAGSKKVFKIVRSDANSPLVEFVYDPFGIRILKIEKPRIAGVVSAGDAWKYTYYTHDANGQTMAVYETMLNTIGKEVHLEEQHIYGAGRIGMTVPHKLIYSGETTITDPAETWTHTLGLKNYEVTNYLGNVNAVVTDRKTLVAPQAATITDLVGISVAGGVITKTGSGSWDAGGASAEAVNAGGYVEWTIGGSVLSANQDIMAGLSYTNAGANPNTISYAWYTNPNGFAYIYESGTIVPGGSQGAYTLGTVLAIRRENGMINYYLNGVLKRSVADPQPQTAMLADFSIRNTGAKIYDLKVSSHPAYDAVVVMKGDYYPFGMQMPGRSDVGDYRYGYNGMEKDDEVKGGGNSYTTEFRQYDPRLGRWLSLDPLMMMFPWMSPYVAFDNNPILFVDPFGLKSDDPNYKTKDGKKVTILDEVVVKPKSEKYPRIVFRDTPISKDGTWQPQPRMLTLEQRKQEGQEDDAARSRLNQKYFDDGTPDHIKNAQITGEIYDGVFSFIPGRDILKKLNNGEDISVQDVVLEGIGFIPAGKFIAKGGKFFLKKGDDIFEVSDDVIRKIRPCGCFVSGTKIKTESGFINIEDVKVGDIVWAYDELTKESKLRIVTDIFVIEQDHVLILKVGDEIIKTTEDHPFYLKENWIKAGDLSVGDSLTIFDGSLLPITKIEKLDTSIIVYNFTVDGLNNYYIGQQSILVHNINCLTQSLDAVFNDPSKLHHFIHGSRNSVHNWQTLVPSLNANDIRKIAANVLKNGTDVPYKSGMSKVLSVTQNGVTKSVQIPYTITPAGDLRFSSGWILP